MSGYRKSIEKFRKEEHTKRYRAGCEESQYHDKTRQVSIPSRRDATTDNPRSVSMLDISVSVKSDPPCSEHLQKRRRLEDDANQVWAKKAKDDWRDSHRHEPQTVQASTSNRKPRRPCNKLCTVPDCQIGEMYYRKAHAYNFHLPSIFREFLDTTDKRVVKIRIEAVLEAAALLLGRPATLTDLMEYINQHGLLEPNACKWTVNGGGQLKLMREVCEELKLSLPELLTFDPINHVALLFYWRVLYNIAALLPREYREHWRTSHAHLDDMGSTRKYRAAADSHFYLDRLQTAAGMRPDATVWDVMEANTMPEHRRVKIVCAVANYCDPDTYPTATELTQLPPEVRVCIGLHPQHAKLGASWIQNSLDRLGALLSHAKVYGIGEIGLDHSVNMEHWYSQNLLVQKIAPLVKPYHVLVVYCRGMLGDDGVEAHKLLMHLLKKGDIPKRQLIHVRGFDGNLAILKYWLKAFPDTHFSFNRSVSTFNCDQLEALEELDDDRLLIETSAPYFSSPSRTFSSPSELFDVAECIARTRQKCVRDIFEITTSNALRLYS